MKALLVAVALASGAAIAQEPCGGPIEVVNGMVETQNVLTGVAKDDECLKAIASMIAADREVRSVTVEMRVLDDQRVGGRALKIATRAAGVLTANGVPQERVSAVVPRADGEEQGLKIIVRTLPPPPPTVQILSLYGEALGGHDESKLEAKRPGAGLVVKDVYVTRKGGAVLSLPDSGNVRLGADTKVTFLPPTEKSVDALALATGTLVIETLPSGNGVEIVLAQTTVRIAFGPASRGELGLAGDKWTLAVYDGKADVITSDATVSVDAGNGVAGQGISTQTPRPLLPPPKVSTTLGMPLAGELKWGAVAGASKYRVELAHDATFGATTIVQTAPTQTASVDPSIGTGRFFFRVTALDDADVPGSPSKVYSFTR